jgi:hypothetical protein
MHKSLITLGGRRYLLVLAVLIISSVLVFDKSIFSSDYKDILIAIVAVYISGNTYQKVKGVPDA